MGVYLEVTTTFPAKLFGARCSPMVEGMQSSGHPLFWLEMQL